MGMAIVSSLALVAVLGSGARGRGPVARLGAVAGVAGAVACTAFAADTALARAGQNAAWLAQGAPCQPPAGIERLGCFALDEDHVRAIQYVQQRTAPGEATFAGLGRYDKVFVNDIAFYFLADRRSVTKWHDVNPGLQTTAPIQRQIVAALDSKRPRLIVLESQWDDKKEPNASALSGGVTILDDYIRAHYVPVARFGPITVLQDVSAAPS
jgi:hypothetical protein